MQYQCCVVGERGRRRRASGIGQRRQAALGVNVDLSGSGLNRTGCIVRNMAC
jgi:hypothetical protein